MAFSPEDRVVLVYDSDHGVLGDLVHLAEKLVGGGECALCDITHGGVREKASFRACRESFPLPLETRYRDQASSAMRAAAVVWPAALLVRGDGSVTRLLDRDALRTLGGDVDALRAALVAALR